MEARESAGHSERSKVTVSIVVLVVDRLDMLRRCVESVEAHTRSPYEWVFILNGPSPEVRAYVESLPLQPPCTGHWVGVSETNKGVTPGRNHGILLAQGDLILFLDDDAWVSEIVEAMPRFYDGYGDWLDRMAQYFENDPKVGVVSQSGSYLNTQGGAPFWGCKVAGAECDVGMGYCFMFRRSLVNEIGPLDPYFGHFWHEESEFALRTKAAGYKVINAGYIGVSHAGAGSGDDGTSDDKLRYIFRKWSARFPEILVPREGWNKV